MKSGSSGIEPGKPNHQPYGRSEQSCCRSGCSIRRHLWWALVQIICRASNFPCHVYQNQMHGSSGEKLHDFHSHLFQQHSVTFFPQNWNLRLSPSAPQSRMFDIHLSPKSYRINKWLTGIDRSERYDGGVDESEICRMINGVFLVVICQEYPREELNSALRNWLASPLLLFQACIVRTAEQVR